MLIRKKAPVCSGAFAVTRPLERDHGRPSDNFGVEESPGFWEEKLGEMWIFPRKRQHMGWENAKKTNSDKTPKTISGVPQEREFLLERVFPEGTNVQPAKRV